MLSSQEPSTGFLREILAKHVVLATAWDRKQLLRLFRADRYDVFLCDWDFRGGEWKEVCRDIRQQDPNLPAIVVCRLGEEQEWIEVLEAGCFDILAAPYSECSVLGVLEHAVASHEALKWRTVA